MFCPGMLGMAMPYIAEVWVVVRIDDLGRISSFLLRLLVVSFAWFLGIWRHLNSTNVKGLAHVVRISSSDRVDE